MYICVHRIGRVQLAIANASDGLERSVCLIMNGSLRSSTWMCEGLGHHIRLASLRLHPFITKTKASKHSTVVCRCERTSHTILAVQALAATMPTLNTSRMMTQQNVWP